MVKVINVIRDDVLSVIASQEGHINIKKPKRFINKILNITFFNPPKAPIGDIAREKYMLRRD